MVTLSQKSLQYWLVPGRLLTAFGYKRSFLNKIKLSTLIYLSLLLTYIVSL